MVRPTWFWPVGNGRGEVWVRCVHGCSFYTCILHISDGFSASLLFWNLAEVCVRNFILCLPKQEPSFSDFRKDFRMWHAHSGDKGLKVASLWWKKCDISGGDDFH